ncbi:MAG: TRAP transporter small permease subunit [Desulfarculus sp.]|nr:TRAP transporter small permease subunit [Desulfarculus sp.]
MFDRILAALDKALTWFEEWTLFICVVVGMVSLFINVVLRYGFNYTMAWSEELIRESIIYTTFVGCATAIKNRSQIVIDVVVQLVPRLRTPFTWVCHCAVLFFSAFLMRMGTVMAIQQASTDQTTVILEIPLEILYAILPLMGALMFIRTVQAMRGLYLEGRAGRAAA